MFNDWHLNLHIVNVCLFYYVLRFVVLKFSTRAPSRLAAWLN